MARHAVLFLLCALATSAPAEVKYRTVRPSDTQNVVEGNTRFALKLYDQLRAREGNLFFSPFSISTALAMTSAGARGRTLKQMETTLALPDRKTLHSGLARLLGELSASDRKGGFQLSVANALWGQSGHQFNPEFVQLLQKRYRAGFRPLDFAKPREAARQEINRWVEEKTNDRIKDLIKPGVLDAQTRLILTNAIYFKAEWSSQFLKDNTRKADFHLADGKKVKTEMMGQKGRFAHGETRDLQVLEMPYVGNDVSMVVLLPRKPDGLPALEKSLKPAALEGWLGGLREQSLDVYLPRFKVTSEFDLRRSLSALGMEEAFTRQADFSGMDGKKDLYLSAVVHKAFVKVTEKGTEAAAATGVAIASRSIERKAREFRADRPFLFLLRDRRSGSILFLGRLSNPNR
jgi:serpin B